MKDITIFKNQQFGEIRTLTDEQGEPWFVGRDVAKALGYNNAQKAVLQHVDELDKTTVPIWDTGSNYKTRAVIINESGLYSLILSSKLESAKSFKRWVTSEVLPQIRKTGGYIPTHDAEGRQLTAKEVIALADEIVGKTIKMVNAPACQCFTATDVARSWGLETNEFNQLLRRMGIQHRKGGRWCLAPHLEGMGLTEVRHFMFYSLQGERRSKQYMVWTAAGVEYLNRRFLAQPSETPKVIQLNFYVASTPAAPAAPSAP